MNEPYQDIVTIFPPEKSPEGDTVLLKFQTRTGEVLRLRVSDAIARNLGTQLVLLSATLGAGVKRSGTPVSVQGAS